MVSALPAGEAGRLDALRRYNLLQSDADPAFDELVRLATQVCDAPIALISIIDERRQLIRASAGTTLSELPRDVSPCARAILGSDVLVVPDLAADTRFAQSPIVTGHPYVRAYAGAPLVTHDGHVLGTLCVMDHMPRPFSPRQKQGLAVLARQVMTQIELRWQVRERIESEARYRALFEYTPDGILIADDRSYYLDANRAMCRMLGYARDQLIGLHAADIVAPAEIEHIDPALQQIASRADYRREWLFKRRDGTTFPADVLVTTMPDGRLLALVRDVTERKKLERQFLRAQRMESIGTLAGGIAHDLNNVLTPVLMSLEVLEGLATSEEDRGLVATLRTSAERGADLVRQVLSFARGVEGQRLIVNPLRTVNELLAVMRETFPKSIDVELRAAPRSLDCDRRPDADPSGLHEPVRQCARRDAGWRAPRHHPRERHAG